MLKYILGETLEFFRILENISGSVIEVEEKAFSRE